MTDLEWARLLLFLAGKFAITISYTVMYVYNAELFPTQLRHSLLGACVMFGQIGSILAPQTPLLVSKTWFDGFTKHQHFKAQYVQPIMMCRISAVCLQRVFSFLEFLQSKAWRTLL